MKTIATLFIATLGLATSVVASPEATLTGSISDNGRPVAVTLTVPASKVVGKTAGKLKFGGAWQCAFTLEFAQSLGNKDTWSLQGAGAGRCVTLNSGFLRTKPADSGRLDIELRDGTNTPRYTATLNPASR